MLVALSQWFTWRDALVNVQADTLLRWHRQGFRLFWRWKSKTTGRPRLPNNLQGLIREMAADHPTWGQERIANELPLKLGVRVPAAPAARVAPRKSCLGRDRPRCALLQSSRARGNVKLSGGHAHGGTR